jgi:transposase InsO family protein
MRWGPKKICAKFKERYPTINCPGTTTTENILERNGLVRRRKKRRRLPIKPSIILPTDELNYTWCMDFKGGCITSDYHKFDPFTLTYYDSRYLINCLKLPRNNTAYVWNILEIAFKEFGLPMIIRSDNGPPFATCAPGRLSPLSIKLVKAGVIPDWIEPGNPQQNGRHERMHLTMEQEGFHPGSTLKDQTKRLEEFQTYYNFDRPHEALQQRTPASLFVPSNRTWNGRLQPMEYTNDFKVGKVRSCGKMVWNGKEVYISRVFAGENIGIKEEDGFNVYYGPIFLGRLINGNELEVKRRDSRKRYKSPIKS